MIDREPLSPTYGCGDRTFWQWKFVDFPGARFQESASLLARLYANPFDGNEYAGKEKVLEWCYAVMDYWASLTNRDGSHNEAYPGERSFVATAFSLFSVTEALLALGEEGPGERRERIVAAAGRSGRWLLRNVETHAFISNHRLGAVVALYNLSLLTGEASFRAHAEELRDTVAERQSPEGWFTEYGGADPGYQTQAIWYLAEYHRRSRDAKALEMLRRAAAFNQYFIHPDGTLGGEYGSRNTEFYFPGGIELLASEGDAVAHAIAGNLRPSIGAGGIASLRAMDAYNLLPLANSHMTALLHCSGGMSSHILPKDDPRFTEIVFPEAGLYVRRTAAYYAVAGLKKGGVLKVYDLSSRRLVQSNCGYAAVMGPRSLCSSQWDHPHAEISRSDGGYTVRVPFIKVTKIVMSTPTFVLFRLLLLATAAIPCISRAIKGLIVKRLIYDAREVPLVLTRRIDFGTRSVAVHDTIEKRGEVRLRRLLCLDKFTSIHMGSSKYFQPSELETSSILAEADLALLDREGWTAFSFEGPRNE